MKYSFSRKDALNAVEQSRELFYDAGESLKAVKDTMRRIRSAVSNAKFDAAVAALRDISVDRLEGPVSPHRIQLLKDNGINSIADVYQQGHNAIRRIDGIGPKTVAAIAEASAKLRAEAEANVPLELPEDPAAMTAAQRDLVYRSCLFLDTRPSYLELNQLVAKYEPERKKYVAAMNRVTRLYNWLIFGSSKLIDADETYMSLYAMAYGSIGMRLRNNAEAIRSVFTNTTMDTALARYSATPSLRDWILTKAPSLDLP